MSLTYIDTCVKEALGQAKGNRTEAARILMARSLEDKLLEDGLFAAFREAATHYHVQRVAHQLESQLRPNPSMDEQAFDSLVNNLQKNLSSNPSSPQPANAAATPTKGGASALRAIAGAFSSKKKPSDPVS